MNDLERKFNILFDFLQTHVDYLAKSNRLRNGAPDREKLRTKFIQGRQPKAPTTPSTASDPAVLDVMVHYFDVPRNHVETAESIHKTAMGAENIVGDILERYLASELEDNGWIWASGSTVKAIDFIKKTNSGWTLLQIKNRDNSENSSSSSVREGTNIKKWFRSFSKYPGRTNWGNFPERNVELSEEGFRTFLVAYLQRIHP